MIFRILLWSIGALLAVRSRTSARLRAQLARDLVITIGSRDGIARSFLFRDRRVSSRPGSVDGADLRLLFATASTGARVLLAPDAVRRIVRGVSDESITLEGLPTRLLWFYEMVMGVLPWRRTPTRALPGACVAPDPKGRAAARITREPVQAALDPDDESAHLQRAKLVIWEVAKGAPSAGAIPGYRHVVDLPPAQTEETP